MAISSLLQDPNCRLHTLNLKNNSIRNEGATSLANSLARNNRLRELYLGGNPIDQSVYDVFSKILCDASSIYSLYSSNHTLNMLRLPEFPENAAEINERGNGMNKSQIAMKKILKYHPNFDIKPFFGWNMEGDGEQDLKALPYILDWFDRAVHILHWHDKAGKANIDRRKLDTIYQFANVMPLLFVPGLHIKEGKNNKRKRDE